MILISFIIQQHGQKGQEVQIAETGQQKSQRIMEQHQHTPRKSPLQSLLPTSTPTTQRIVRNILGLHERKIARRLQNQSQLP